MGSHVTNLLSAAESLTEAERRELIELLAAGLDDPAIAGVETEPAVLSESWQRAVAERSAEYDAGLAETVPWEEVLAKWRERRERPRGTTKRLTLGYQI